MSITSTEEQLKRYIERIENINEEIKGSQDDRKDIYIEAKSNGFEVKILKEIVKLRKKTRDERLQDETILETYKAAIGMDV